MNISAVDRSSARSKIKVHKAMHPILTRRKTVSSKLAVEFPPRWQTINRIYSFPEQKILQIPVRLPASRIAPFSHPLLLAMNPEARRYKKKSVWLENHLLLSPAHWSRISVAWRGARFYQLRDFSPILQLNVTVQAHTPRTCTVAHLRVPTTYRNEMTVAEV